MVCFLMFKDIWVFCGVVWLVWFVMYNFSVDLMKYIKYIILLVEEVNVYIIINMWNWKR